VEAKFTHAPSVSNIFVRFMCTGCVTMHHTLAARGLEELFSSCAVLSVFGSGGK
jgi:hypothetical protein